MLPKDKYLFHYYGLSGCGLGEWDLMPGIQYSVQVGCGNHQVS